MENNKIILSEKLHIVVQGEGELIGKKMILIRVFGCPLQCPNCDSFHTWDITRLTDYKKEYSIEQLQEEILTLSKSFNIKYVMFTGGEPQIYREQIDSLIYSLMRNVEDMRFEIETTGSVSWPTTLTYNEKVHFDLSPKIGSLVSKANIKEWRIFLDFISWFNVKIVTSKNTFEDDLRAIRDFQKKYDIPDRLIYLMPLGTTREEMIRESAFVLEKAIENNFQFSPRLHIFIYDSKRLV